MRGYSYHFAPTDKPGIVKLRPTKSTYAKAFLPTLVVWGVVAIAVAAVNAVDNKKLDENPVTEQDPIHE